MAFEEGDWVDFMLGNLDKSPSAKYEVTENHALVTAEKASSNEPSDASHIFATPTLVLPETDKKSLFVFKNSEQDSASLSPFDKFKILYDSPQQRQQRFKPSGKECEKVLPKFFRPKNFSQASSGTQTVLASSSLPPLKTIRK